MYAVGAPPFLSPNPSSSTVLLVSLGIIEVKVLGFKVEETEECMAIVAPIQTRTV